MMNTDFIIIILLVVLILVFFFNPSQNLVNMESFTTSENIEAIQNLASMYENGKLNVTDLNVSGNLNATNLNVSSNLNVNGQTNLKNTKILGSGSIGGEKGYLGFDDAGNITTSNITAYGDITARKEIVANGKIDVKGGIYGDITGKNANFGGTVIINKAQLNSIEGNNAGTGDWNPIYFEKENTAFVYAGTPLKRHGFGLGSGDGKLKTFNV